MSTALEVTGWCLLAALWLAIAAWPLIALINDELPPRREVIIRLATSVLIVSLGIGTIAALTPHRNHCGPGTTPVWHSAGKGGWTTCEGAP